MREAGIAVIGFGMAGEFHLRAIREIAGARLVCVSARHDGRARDVAASVHSIESEDVGLELVEFESGAVGTIMASTSIRPGFTPSLALCGEKGTIKEVGSEIFHWSVPDIPAPAPAEGVGAGGGARDPKAISHRCHRLQIEDVLEAIRLGRPSAVTAEDGLRAVRLVASICRSSETGLPVELGEP